MGVDHYVAMAKTDQSNECGMQTDRRMCSLQATLLMVFTLEPLVALATGGVERALFTFAKSRTMSDWVQFYIVEPNSTISD